jgi:hypothetical protein
MPTEQKSGNSLVINTEKDLFSSLSLLVNQAFMDFKDYKKKLSSAMNQNYHELSVISVLGS